MLTFILPLKCLQQIFTPPKLLLLLYWEIEQSYMNIKYTKLRNRWATIHNKKRCIQEPLSFHQVGNQ